jgi:tripartite-type tricarboxylate transporter receptor subunit TctC
MLGQPYLAPPGAPTDRVAVLRKAFDATMHDKAFLADAEKLSYSVTPLSADEVARIIHETVTAPPSVVAKARALINAPEAGGAGR